MKKMKYLLVALVSILIVTGCGKVKEETLTCSNIEEENGVKMTQTITMKFRNNKINFVETKFDAKATNDLMKENWDIMRNTLSASFDSSQNEDGVKLIINDDKDKYLYSVAIQADLDKATKEALEKYDLEDITDSDDTLKDVKKDAEEDGFTCK